MAFGKCAILQQADDFDNMANMRRQEILENTYKNMSFTHICTYDNGE